MADLYSRLTETQASSRLWPKRLQVTVGQGVAEILKNHEEANGRECCFSDVLARGATYNQYLTLGFVLRKGGESDE